MGFLIVIAACIAGLFIGGMGDGGDIALGFFGGLAIGIVAAIMRGLSARVDALRDEIKALQNERVPHPATPTQTQKPLQPAQLHFDPAPPSRTETSSPLTDTSEPEFDFATPAPPPRPTPSTPASESPRIVIRSPRAPSGPDPVQRLVDAIKRWFTDGNVPVKVGVLVLFAGIAALLKYASDQGWLRLPIEYRLVGVALAAIAALMFGWRERVRRRSFALSIQGGAIGVLLLTVFAAFRLYHLLPAAPAFALMLVLVAGAGVLAVLQDSLALAVLGILAGFAAPILISTGSGDHVVLFSYYALLNLAIFAIAWVKPWRALNLLGFFFTYAIATTWGVLRYEHALFTSTEPFLLIFFAIYLAVPILYARRQEPQRRDLVDGTLVFGNPLIAFALQAALLEGERMPLAYSALALAALYALLGAWQMPRRRVLGESFAVLAVGFATLAVPLALSARSTACTFALEGAALVWLGLRQQRRLPQITGIALQALSAFAFVCALAFGSHETDPLPIANGVCISAVLIAASAFICAWLYHRRNAARHELEVLLYLWGLAWWVGAGLREIDRFVADARQPSALLAFVALTAAAAAFATQRTHAMATACTAAFALAGGVLFALWFGAADIAPFTSWGLGAFAIYAAAGVFALHELGKREDFTTAFAHIGWLWTWTLALAVTLYQFADDQQLGSGWRAALTALPLLVAWALSLLRPGWIAFPLRERFAGYRGSSMLLQALVATAVFCMLLLHEGTSAPAAWIPLLNPVELVQLGVLVCVARWLVDRDVTPELASHRAILLAIGGFLFVTAATLRATHHLGDVPWDANLWSSNQAQTALTVVWSILGVIGWVVGSRRGKRVLWLAGAVLMAVVLAKLLLIDRSRLGNLFGIASFIAYGLLCTVIGYFAPAPPREEAAEPTP